MFTFSFQNFLAYVVLWLSGDFVFMYRIFCTIKQTENHKLFSKIVYVPKNPVRLLGAPRSNIRTNVLVQL